MAGDEYAGGDGVCALGSKNAFMDSGLLPKCAELLGSLGEGLPPPLRGEPWLSWPLAITREAESGESGATRISARKRIFASPMGVSN